MRLKLAVAVTMLLGMVTGAHAQIVYTPPAGGGITSGTTTITGGGTTQLCYNNAGVISCGDADLTFDGTMTTMTGATVSGGTLSLGAAGTPGILDALGTGTAGLIIRSNTAVSGGVDNGIILRTVGNLAAADFTLRVQDNNGTDLLTVDGAAGTTISGVIKTAAGATPTCSNVAANSCGTTACTVAGNENVGIVTVGATSGTQ